MQTVPDWSNCIVEMTRPDLGKKDVPFSRVETDERGGRQAESNTDRHHGTNRGSLGVEEREGKEDEDTEHQRIFRVS